MAPGWTSPTRIANRRETLLRQIGYGIINRRFQSLSRQADPPFRGAGFGTSDVFHIGRTTNLIVETPDGGWARAGGRSGHMARGDDHGLHPGRSGRAGRQLAHRHRERRRGRSHAQQCHAGQPGAVAAARRYGADPERRESAFRRLFHDHARQRDGRTAPRGGSARPSADPLSGTQGPEGGAAALRHTWQAAMAACRGRTGATASTFTYTDFGTPGTMVADSTDAALGIRPSALPTG
jgi:zinc protease